MRFDQFIVEAGKVKDAALAWLTDFVDSRIANAFVGLAERIDSLESFRSEVVQNGGDEVDVNSLHDRIDDLDGRVDTLEAIELPKVVSENAIRQFIDEQIECAQGDIVHDVMSELRSRLF